MTVKQFKYLFISLRPEQWLKNLVVFAALVFSGNLLNIEMFKATFLTFVAFCMASSGNYILNDLRDRSEDLLHPDKKNRPIAAGQLLTSVALLSSILFILGALIIQFSVGQVAGLVLIAYLAIAFIYTLWLKHIAIVDIILIASGFVLRAIAGGFAINVPISSWLIVCTFFLALFLIIGKRKSEMFILKENGAGHRKSLDEYSPEFLDRMIVITSTLTIAAFAFYTLDEESFDKFGTSNLIYAIPFVLVGVFRYLYLIYVKNFGGKPEKILLTDKVVLLSVIGWIVATFFILYLK